MLCSHAVAALRRRESVEGLSDYNVRTGRRCPPFALRCGWTRGGYELRPAKQRMRRIPRLTQLLIVRIRRRPSVRPSVALLGEGFLSPAREGGREGGGNEIDRVTERVLFHLTLMAPGRPTDRPTDRTTEEASNRPSLPPIFRASGSAAPTSIRCR